MARNPGRMWISELERVFHDRPEHSKFYLVKIGFSKLFSDYIYPLICDNGREFLPEALDELPPHPIHGPLDASSIRQMRKHVYRAKNTVS